MELMFSGVSAVSKLASDAQRGQRRIRLFKVPSHHYLSPLLSFPLCLFQRMRQINLCVSSVPGAQRQLGGDPPAGAAGAGDGRHHGGVLPGVLAAVRGRRSARHLRPPRPHHPRGEHHAVAAGQVLHRHQPLYLYIHEQTGEAFSSYCFLLRPSALLSHYHTSWERVRSAKTASLYVNLYSRSLS